MAEGIKKLNFVVIWRGCNEMTIGKLRDKKVGFSLCFDKPLQLNLKRMTI
jgi:hypothetical protein